MTSPIVQGAWTVRGTVSVAARAMTCAAIIWFAAACGGTQPPSPSPPPSASAATVFVGHVEDSDALIAVLVDGRSLTVYACGGDGTWQSHTGWFYGELVDGAFDLRHAGLEVSGRVEGARALGTLTLADGRALAFEAERAEPGTSAGLYYRQTYGDRTGLIVANDFSATGVRYRYDAGTTAPVTVEDDLGDAATTSVRVRSMGDTFDVSRLQRTIEPPPAPEGGRRVVFVGAESALLTARGETFAFEAVVVDPDGEVDRDAPIQWSSNHPSVSVDGDGRVTAQNDVGYAFVTASSGAAEPAQASVMIVELDPSATVLEDHHVVAADGEAHVYVLRSDDVTQRLQPGDIILSELAFTRIVGITPDGDTLGVVGQEVGVHEAFRRASIDLVHEVPEMHISSTFSLDHVDVRTADVSVASSVERSQVSVPLQECEITIDAGQQELIDVSLLAIDVTMAPTISSSAYWDDAGDFFLDVTVAAEPTITIGGPNASFGGVVSGAISCAWPVPGFDKLTAPPINIPKTPLVLRLGFRPYLGFEMGIEVQAEASFSGPSITFSGTTEVSVTHDPDDGFGIGGGEADFNQPTFNQFDYDSSLGVSMWIGPFVKLKPMIGVGLVGVEGVTLYLAELKVFNKSLVSNAAPFNPLNAGFKGVSWYNQLGAKTAMKLELDAPGLQTLSSQLGAKLYVTLAEWTLFEEYVLRSPQVTVSLSPQSVPWNTELQLSADVAYGGWLGPFITASPIVRFAAFPVSSDIPEPFWLTIGTSQVQVPGDGESTATWIPDDSIPVGDYRILGRIQDGFLYGSNAGDPADATVTVTPVRVTIDPTEATIDAEDSLTFTATVENADDTSVTWSAEVVEGVPGTSGSFQGSGNTVSWSSDLAGTYRITATSVEEEAARASALVTVLMTIDLEPESVDLLSNEATTFTATIKGAQDPSAAWVATGGSIDPVAVTATYTAPDAAGHFTLVAASVEDPDVQASATIRVDEAAIAPYAHISNVELGEAQHFLGGGSAARSVTFDIAWEDSWRGDDRPPYVAADDGRDAAWVFMKYRLGPSEPWQHATLRGFGHTEPANAFVEIGEFDGVSGQGPGAFVYRRPSQASGPFETQVELLWQHAHDGVDDDAEASIKLFAIEHVFVPLGPFTAGGVGGESNAFAPTIIGTSDATAEQQTSYVRLGERGDDPDRAQLLQHPARPTAAVFHPSDAVLFTGMENGAIAAWDLDLMRPLAGFPGLSHDDPITALAVSPDGSLLASADDRGNLRLWRYGVFDLRADVNEHNARLNDLAFGGSIGDRFMLASAGFDASIALWEAGESGLELLHTFSDHTAPVTAVSFLPQAPEVLFSTSLDATLRAWDTSSWEVMHVAENVSDTAVAINDLAVSASGDDTVFTVDDAGRIVLWRLDLDAGFGSTVMADLLGRPLASVALDETRDVVKAGTTSGTVWQIDLGPEPTPQVHSSGYVSDVPVRVVLDGPEGRRIVTLPLRLDAGGFPAGEEPPSSPAWPNGFGAFYVMKYPLMQRQYAAFLNTLDQTQANARMHEGSGDRYAITGDAVGWYRSSLPFLPMNSISWADSRAFATWAGLRPLTELEYEKAARGPVAPVADEFAWGDTSATATTGIAFEGTLVEVAGNAAANATFAALVAGPLRAGSFATDATSRATAGAGYYGALDLSGTLAERYVSIATTTGRSFSGAHGDGTLTGGGDGYGSSQGWPAFDAGVILRGGSWASDEARMRLADRALVDLGNAGAGRDGTYGFRAGRTAP